MEYGVYSSPASSITVEVIFNELNFIKQRVTRLV